MDKRVGACTESYVVRISINTVIKKPLLLRALYIEPTNFDEHSIVPNTFLKPKRLLDITKWCSNPQSS